MKLKTQNLNIEQKRAFTLLEVIVAMVVLTIALSVAFQAFSGTIRAWKRGTEVIDGMKHGDFAMNQLVSAINSTIYFNNPRKTYAFKVEKNTSAGLPADEISFVTSSGAFMPEYSPFTDGPHRIKLLIDDDDRGNPALFVIAMPAIANDEDFEDEYDAEPELASRAVQGLEVLFWDDEAEDWTEEWEKENSVPERILLTVFVVSDDEDEEPIEFARVIDIPVARSVEAKLRSPSSTDQSSGSTGNSGGGNNSITIGGAK
ncbi:type II secretion system protein [Pontiella sulfatireligans]|uniref:type II secretion system protein n=1 Tax=Pontiella sulfatireligans TaxID=2750658 RepID=UPI001443C350|nr:type II secretion system protein [Pontiella sulfatireligans]